MVCLTVSVFFFFGTCVWLVEFCFLFFLVFLSEVLQLLVCGAVVVVFEDGVGGGGGDGESEVCASGHLY